jgi:pimeloyl-ACP methyl ester carboxylesterase
MIDHVKMRDLSSIAVEVVGKGEQVVILMHGIGGSSAMWLPFAHQHKKGYTFVIPNLRGFGKSSTTKFSHPDDVLRDYADDLEMLIDTYSPDNKVILVGLSMGAYTCMRYFKDYGSDKVAKYLNIDQSPKAINSGSWKHGIGGEQHAVLFCAFKALMKSFETKVGCAFAALDPDLQAGYMACIGDFFSLAFHRDFEVRLIEKLFNSKHPVFLQIAKSQRSMHSRVWQSYYNCLKSYVERDYDFRKTMAKLDIPMTLHIGRHSKMYPARGQYYMAHHAPKCKVVEFDEAHGLIYTAPVKFSIEFSKFLSSEASP